MERIHKYIQYLRIFQSSQEEKRGHNIIGQRGQCVPGQHGDNVTICVAISNHGVLHQHVTLGPYNTQHLLTFLAGLRDVLVAFIYYYILYLLPNLRQCHFPSGRSAAVREWFNINEPIICIYLPPYSPFLKPIEEFFSSWRWKVYDREQGWSPACHGGLWWHKWRIVSRLLSRGFFPRCLGRENIACDVDIVLLAWHRPKVWWGPVSNLFCVFIYLCLIP